MCQESDYSDLSLAVLALLTERAELSPITNSHKQVHSSYYKWNVLLRMLEYSNLYLKNCNGTLLEVVQMNLQS